MEGVDPLVSTSSGRSVSSGRNFQLDHKDLSVVQRRRFEHDQITDNRTLREALRDGETKGQSR